ncbi:DoxX family protein [Rhizobium sp. LEGMi198b]
MNTVWYLKRQAEKATIFLAAKENGDASASKGAEMHIDLVEWLRLLCGIWFLPHLIGKGLHYEKAAGTFENAGFRPAKLFVGITMVMEAAAAIGLVFSIYPRMAAAVGAVVMLGAAYAVVKINGPNWRWQKMGPEYPIFWALICLLLAIV